MYNISKQYRPNIIFYSFIIFKLTFLVLTCYTFRVLLTTLNTCKVKRYTKTISDVFIIYVSIVYNLVLHCCFTVINYVYRTFPT